MVILPPALVGQSVIIVVIITLVRIGTGTGRHRCRQRGPRGGAQPLHHHLPHLLVKVGPEEGLRDTNYAVLYPACEVLNQPGTAMPYWEVFLCVTKTVFFQMYIGGFGGRKKWMNTYNINLTKINLMK